MPGRPSSSASTLLQTLVGAGVVVLALGLAMGAFGITSHAGYSGVGPNFLPWLVAAALFVCGCFMVYEARSGGFRDMQEPTAVKPCWSGFVWVSTGLLLNAVLITSIGFVLSSAVCFVLAARGLRYAQGQSVSQMRHWLQDTVTGLLIAAPVYWMFTQFLSINLPGLTHGGWL